MARQVKHYRRSKKGKIFSAGRKNAVFVLRVYEPDGEQFGHDEAFSSRRGALIRVRRIEDSLSRGEMSPISIIPRTKAYQYDLAYNMSYSIKKLKVK